MIPSALPASVAGGVAPDLAAKWISTSPPRAIDVLRYLEQQNVLDRLAKVLSEI